MSLAIKVENLSKAYYLGEIGTGTLSRDIERYIAKVRGKEDPFLKVGETNDRTQKGSSDVVWSLRDVDFEIEQGDAVGIIGRNGAGKSTLLKILSRVTAPTIGNIKVKGRIASLLEVGTGFHPELTGRENIYLNGAILGMRKKEITRKFDEIVSFSGVERYIDTPVKRYSSGMYVRLAFAVAAHLESEILIVDEVLAVGDAEFQKKCLGKMQDVGKSEGRTILFVSHNMSAIKTLCNKGLLLQNGTKKSFGSVENITQEYIRDSISSAVSLLANNRKLGNELVELIRLDIRPINGNVITVESGIYFEIEFTNYKPNINLDVTLLIFSIDDTCLCEIAHFVTLENNSKVGKYIVRGHMPGYSLNAGTYKINVIFGENAAYVLWQVKDVVTFDVENTFFDRGNSLSTPPGYLRPRVDWSDEFIYE